MHIHVFCIDILPGKEVTSTGGGLRSQQIISGLRGAGAHVTYSVPKGTDSVREHWDALSAEERENAFCMEPSSMIPGRNHLDIVGRLKPDAAVYLWPMAFTYPISMSKPLVTVFDMNGFQNVESALAISALSGSPASIASATHEYLNKISCGDLLIAGSEAQAAYWSGVNSLHLDTFQSLDMIEVPYSPNLPEAVDYTVGEPTFFSTGSFLPWNSPEGHLEILADLIKRNGRGRLVIVGKANPILPHAHEVNRRIRHLKQHPFVEVHDGMPYERFSKLINGHGVGIDLNSRTFEREFAIPIRTVTFLAHGVPVITNDYSALSNQIGRLEAGWQVSTETTKDFATAVGSILDGTADVEHRSAQARALVNEQFASKAAFAKLLARIQEKQEAKRPRANPFLPGVAPAESPASRSVRVPKLPRKPPVVLVITDDHENFLQLRVRIPFDAMYHQGKIGGYLVLRHGKIIKSVGNRDDLTKVDVVWVQRGPDSAYGGVMEMFYDRYIYDIDDNLLVSPSYRQPFSPEWRQMIISLLRGAACITSTTPRLIESLQRHSGVQIEHKTLLAPNMTDTVTRRKFAAAPEALLLASSDVIALTASRLSFFSAISKFCVSRDIPLVYMGTPNNLLSEVKTRVVTTGFLDYESYRAFLRNRNVIAIAPLETKGDYLTSEFINSKSDIKMVEFGAAGIPAVFAKAVPYTDSPLSVGPTVDCSDEKAVHDGLDRAYDDADTFSLEANQIVAEHRMADDVAVTLWGRAIDAARLAVPVGIPQILAQVGAANGAKRKTIAVPEEYFNENDYLAMNPDVCEAVTLGRETAYSHYQNYGAFEGRQWFPGTPPSSSGPLIAARFRDFILNEPARVDELERLTAKRRAERATG